MVQEQTTATTGRALTAAETRRRSWPKVTTRARGKHMLFRSWGPAASALSASSGSRSKGRGGSQSRSHRNSSGAGSKRANTSALDGETYCTVRCGTNNTHTNTVVLVDHRPSVGRTVPYEHTRVYLPILQPLFCIHLIFVDLTHVRNQLVCVLSSWRSYTDPISNSASHTTVQRLYLHRSESVSHTSLFPADALPATT